MDQNHVLAQTRTEQAFIGPFRPSAPQNRLDP